MDNKGMEDSCDTGLGLGLGPSPPHKLKPSASNPRLIQPISLTLGLSADEPYRQSSSPHSANSSFSSIKREATMGSEEPERVSSRASDEEEEGSARKKLRLTKEQSALLEDKFKEHTTLNPKQKQALAKQLNLRPRQVEVWFQNRRARTKLKQTEVDCEVLKRCCETLSEENRRLHKELEELKNLKAPVYMQLPAATLTVCPSCQRVSAVGDATKAGPFSVPKAQLLNPFQRSTTC